MILRHIASYDGEALQGLLEFTVSLVDGTTRLEDLEERFEKSIKDASRDLKLSVPDTLPPLSREGVSALPLVMYAAVNDGEGVQQRARRLEKRARSRVRLPRYQRLEFKCATIEE